ncbi:ABC transporter permease [Inconstantimicrobium mannanitabidum]|uniref:Uncharacterized protein n=1 Tax=Inconstantimicrobium mannanitabidum TaxID=1604901 RepID=A0ACB5RIG6_9CLOT|nr:ABC transporter permease [Clostridium sp. TW13]GKX68926.1 hypothetical protein rsdtw13_41840 [Clostridium sp. TW13]
MNRFIALIPRYLIKNRKRNFFVALSIVISVVLLVGVKVTVNSLNYRYRINAFNSGSGRDYALKLQFATEKLGMFLMIIVSIAAIAVVYNIFYITTLERIKEFSMLIVIGSSRGKINELILGEAFLISIVCIPLGLLMGCFGIKALFYFCISKDSDMLKELITKKDIIQAAIMVVISIFVSAFSPSRAMGKISPIEGIKENYINSLKGKKHKFNLMKQRNVFKFLNFTDSMACLNTKKSKKRLIVTVLSLTISIVITTSSLYLLSMFNPQKEAEKSTGGDILLNITDSRGLIKDYAYNDEDIKKIQAINGIKNTRKHKKIDMTITESKTFLTERGKKFLESISTSSKEEDKNQMPVTIYGVDDSEIESFKPYLKEGSLQLNNFSDKPTVIAVQNLHYKEYTNLSIGYNLVVSGTYRDNADGNFQPFKKANFNVAAILESTPIRPIDGQTSIILICSNKTLEIYFGIKEYEMVNVDVDSKATIYEISRSLSSIAKSKNYGNITIINDEISKMNQGNMVIRAVLLGFSMLLVVVGVINILNTMSISVVMRKREFGVLRAVGMSQAEVRTMIIKEGSLYGILSAILGNILSLAASYVIYNTMKADFLENEPFKIPWFIILSIVTLNIIITTLISLPAANRAINNSIVESIKAIE